MLWKPAALIEISQAQLQAGGCPVVVGDMGAGTAFSGSEFRLCYSCSWAMTWASQILSVLPEPSSRYSTCLKAVVCKCLILTLFKVPSIDQLKFQLSFTFCSVVLFLLLITLSPCTLVPSIFSAKTLRY